MFRVARANLFLVAFKGSPVCACMRLVCLETALPCVPCRQGRRQCSALSCLRKEPRPTIGFVVGTWFAKHVSEHELPQALEDRTAALGVTSRHASLFSSRVLCRRQGSLSEVLALLAVLDFLTSADGHGYTATRVLTVKAAQHKCLARAELRLIFGPAEADPVRATAVMRLLQQGGVPPLTHAEGGIAHACAFHWRFRR